MEKFPGLLKFILTWILTWPLSKHRLFCQVYFCFLYQWQLMPSWTLDFILLWDATTMNQNLKYVLHRFIILGSLMIMTCRLRFCVSIFFSRVNSQQISNLQNFNYWIMKLTDTPILPNCYMILKLLKFCLWLWQNIKLNFTKFGYLFIVCTCFPNCFTIYCPVFTWKKMIAKAKKY